MASTTTPHTSKQARVFPKKIDREQAFLGRREYERKNLNDPSVVSSSITLVEPLHTVPDYAMAQRLVVADFFSRSSGQGPLTIVCAPSLHGIQSSQPEVIFNARYESIVQIQSILDKLSLGYTLHSTQSSLSRDSILQLTQQLTTQHALSFRWDVCYYNIYSGTVVPDHRVSHELRQGTRYHIRFFVDSKKDVIVASLDDPALLFGCVAVLVNPDDKRYKKFIGKDLIIPLINKNISILAHPSISMMGSGTHLLIPAHDRNDFQLALELGLPYNIYAVDQFGLFTAEAKEFQGKHKDEFVGNIIQFIDDIANLEKKESLQLSYPVDRSTGDALLPLLHQNIYCSLIDGSLKDTSLVQHITLTGDTHAIEEEIEKDERWCVSAHDTKQPIFPVSLDEVGALSPLQTPSSLGEHLLLDLYMLGCISFPSGIDTIIHALLLKSGTTTVGERILESLSQYYPSEALQEFKTLLEQLLNDDNELYTVSIEGLAHLLDTSEGVVFTQRGYLLSSLNCVDCYYDYEYVACGFLSDLISNKDSLTAFCYGQDSDRFKHILYLHRIVSTQPYPQVSLVSLVSSDNHKSLNTLLSYPSEVVRLFLLCEAALPQEDALVSFSLDELHRFLNKIQNACRVLWGSLEERFVVQDFTSNYTINAEQYNDYDTWLLARLYYLWEEVGYYRSKYALNKLLSLLIEIFRFEVSEMGVWIMKYHQSPYTKDIMRFVIVIAIHLLYPVTPTFAFSLLHTIGVDLDSNLITSFFESVSLKKNYKCTLMMDAISRWEVLLATSGEVSLFVQANRDFTDYITQQKDFIISYFGTDRVEDIRIFHDMEILPEEVVVIDMVTMKIGILARVVVSQTEVLQPTISLTVLQGQLSYKKQLLQTMKNTMVRLRNVSGQQQTFVQLQTDVDTLVREIEQLEYQISKIKYL